MTDSIFSVNRVDTLSKDGTYYAYPSTPSRVQLSIWPAGIPSSPQGTVEWAGGMINWEDPDYVAQGNQFTIVIQKVAIKCSQETSTTVANNGTLPPGSDAYVYTTNDTKSGVVPRVFVSNESTNVNAGFKGIEGVGLGFGVGVASAIAAVLGTVGFFL